MIEPWDLKQDDARNADSIVNFIIFCEDRASEYVYLRHFETSKIKINFQLEQKQRVDLINNAIIYCRDNGFIEYRDNEPFCKDNGPQIWCIYDLDRNLINESENLRINGHFDISITAGKNCGFNIAWSNDNFELWILLHFEDIDPSLIENKNRSAYYERLTSILKNIPEQSDELIQALTHPTFEYKAGLKSEKKFSNVVMPLLKDKIRIAIERAKRLEQHFASQNIPNHQKAPCTQVHHLVEELLRVGGKEI